MSLSSLFLRPSPLTDVDTQKFRVLYAAFERNYEAAVRRNVERTLVVGRASERAGGGSDCTLLRPRHRRAISSRVDANHGLRDMRGYVERASSTEGEVVAKQAGEGRLDRSGSPAGLQRRSQHQPAARYADPSRAV